MKIYTKEELHPIQGVAQNLKGKELGNIFLN